MTQIEQIRAEIERLKEHNRQFIFASATQVSMEAGVKQEAYNEMLAFIDSLPAESCLSECIWWRTPSEESCRYCTAWCHLREPKVKVSTDCSFKEYLRGVFEVNNGIENDPDLLVKLHAPTLLELAQKELAESPDFEVEWKRYTASRKDDTRTNAVTMNVKEVAKHFAEWQKKQFEKNRLAACDAQTKEEYERETAFVDKIVIGEHRMPTFSDAINYGINWQKKQDDELLTIAHLDGVAAGREAERKEMMKEVVEGRYMKTIDGEYYVESSVFPPDGFVQTGGKVKLIILKGDD